MSRLNTSSVKYRGLNKNAINGRRSTRYATATICMLPPSFTMLRLKEAQTKYRESKAELDELVANMEGL